jgi:hypothetical protein
MLTSLRTNFVLVLGLMTAVVLGLAHVLRDLSSGTSLLPGRGSAVELADPPLELTEATALFETDVVASQTLPAGSPGGFHTTHFAPPPKPPRQEPTTQKVDLTYLGFLQAGDGPRTAIVQTGSKQWTGGIGSNLVANVFVAAIDQRMLVVTNTEGQTNHLQFRSKTALDVPLQ